MPWTAALMSLGRIPTHFNGTCVDRKPNAWRLFPNDKKFKTKLNERYLIIPIIQRSFTEIFVNTFVNIVRIINFSYLYCFLFFFVIEIFTSNLQLNIDRTVSIRIRLKPPCLIAMQVYKFLSLTFTV